jgi:hypothetical protein
MNTTLQLSCPDELEVTMTIKGTVGEFRRVKKMLVDSNALTYSYPLSVITDSLRDAISKAEQQFTFGQQP